MAAPSPALIEKNPPPLNADTAVWPYAIEPFPAPAVIVYPIAINYPLPAYKENPDRKEGV